MNRETLRDSVKQRPFKPFVIRLTNDQQFRIDDSDRIAVSPDQEIAIVFTPGHYHVIDTTKVASLEVLP